MTVPSRGHVHTIARLPWCYYPDGVRAMAAFAGLEVREVHTDFPPKREDGHHHYERIDEVDHYWGDTVGVLQKTEKYPTRRIALAAVAPVVGEQRVQVIREHKRCPRRASGRPATAEGRGLRLRRRFETLSRPACARHLFVTATIVP